MSDPERLRLSWSRLRVHDECPAKGQLLRTHKSPIQDIRNFYHGNVVDLCMRRRLTLKDTGPDWMVSQVDAIFEEAEVIARETGDGIVKWKGPADKDETREFCRECVTRLEPILQKYCLPFYYDPAVRFTVPITIPYLDGSMVEIDLTGEMDLVVWDNQDRYVVWDLKATKDDQYYKKVLGQLSFYAIVIRVMKGKFPVKTGLIQPMCTQQVLPVDVTPQAVREMSARITRTAHDIWAGRLAPKEDDDGCSWCPVHDACPKFSFGGKTGRVSLSRPV